MTLTARSQTRASSISTMSSNGRRQAGYTMVELVIVVAIIAILSSLAYNSYQDSAIKSRRKAATACMMESAQFLERFYTTNLRYDQDGAGVAVVIPPANCRATWPISTTGRRRPLPSAPIRSRPCRSGCSWPRISAARWPSTRRAPRHAREPTRCRSASPDRSGCELIPQWKSKKACIAAGLSFLRIWRPKLDSNQRPPD